MTASVSRRQQEGPGICPVRTTITIGIIANPAAGKDIRRLVARGSVFDTSEKTNILRRVLRAIDALGDDQILIMPDTDAMGARALDGERELEVGDRQVVRARAALGGPRVVDVGTCLREGVRQGLFELGLPAQLSA